MIAVVSLPTASSLLSWSNRLYVTGSFLTLASAEPVALRGTAATKTPRRARALSECASPPWCHRTSRSSQSPAAALAKVKKDPVT